LAVGSWQLAVGGKRQIIGYSPNSVFA